MMVFSENIQSSTASNAKSPLQGSKFLFHRLPANIWTFACRCKIRSCLACKWGLLCAQAHTHAPHRASVQRSGMIYSTGSLLWSVKRARGIIEFGPGGSFRLVGWLTLDCWLAPTTMTAWVCVGWPLIRLTDCLQDCGAGCLFGYFLCWTFWRMLVWLLIK